MDDSTLDRGRSRSESGFVRWRGSDLAQSRLTVLHAECFQILPDDSGAQNGLYVTNYYHPAKVIECSDALFRYFVDRQFLIGGLKKFRVYLRPDQSGGAAQTKPQAENHHPGGTGPPEPHESPLIQVALSLLTS